jgi:hypothetical protein
MLTLFRPSSGELRLEPVARTTNSVLHPWLMGELECILAGLPDKRVDIDAHWLEWSTWRWPDERIGQYTSNQTPEVRLVLVLDNLTGHYTRSFVSWCLEHGVALLYTPLGGSWLNMAESVQRIIVRRAVSGQHYQSSGELMGALTAASRWWNANPTPFVWGGKRQERRRRAKERRHAIGGSGACAIRPLTHSTQALREAA